MKLPALVSIRFFEATARNLSVKCAAEELHVTSGAVTQQVRKLEEFLGRPLFERRSRGLILTTEGLDYYLACQEALTLIGRATDKLMTNENQVVLVSCTPGFATQWLVPRLQDFMYQAKDIDVRVSTSNRKVDLRKEGIHFAVRHGMGEYPGLQSKVLLADDLIPVCSPRLIAPQKTATIDFVREELLLHDEHRGDWRLWFNAAGINHIKSDSGIVFVNSNAVIEAAIAGRGFALVHRALVQSELASGLLIALESVTLKTPIAYHLVYYPDTLIDSVSRRFFDWIILQSKESSI
ncbi:LysR substrate-binding domain-containing protein [Undibacterium sp. SXout11W]|uniref:LysR substrate-binding domain-containing protein n=1 Tax=Undibacterium sp. SXout11W TaxID=3413050 RepID=UPI003BF15982